MGMSDDLSVLNKHISFEKKKQTPRIERHEALCLKNRGVSIICTLGLGPRQSVRTEASKHGEEPTQVKGGLHQRKAFKIREGNTVRRRKEIQNVARPSTPNADITKKSTQDQSQPVKTGPDSTPSIQTPSQR